MRRGVLSFFEISGRYELVRKKGRSFNSPHLLLFERALLVRSALRRRCLFFSECV
jgi:hypothetical protein